MALASSVTGAGKLVSKSSDSRIYRIVPATGGIVEYTETKTVEEREWVALTKSAAETWVVGEKAAGESRNMREDNRIVGSYKAIQTIETITTTKEIIPDPDEEDHT